MVMIVMIEQIVVKSLTAAGSITSSSNAFLLGGRLLLALFSDVIQFKFYHSFWSISIGDFFNDDRVGFCRLKSSCRETSDESNQIADQHEWNVISCSTGTGSGKSILVSPALPRARGWNGSPGTR